MRLLIAALFFFPICPGLAQIQGIKVEEVDNSGAVPGRTYRFYFVMENDSNQVNMVFGDEQHPLEIKSTKPFFQSQYAGPLSTDSNRKLAKEKKDVRFDSWVTIGAADNYENGTTNFLLDFSDFEETGEGLRTTNGAWFCTPGSAQTNPIKGRVLFMQLTTQGVISGKVSVMGRNNKGESWYVYDLAFTSKL
jgi:hypothetical protein